jgi:hypothetical protein
MAENSMTKGRGYEGFETFYNPLKMSLKMNWVILRTVAFVYVALSFLLIFKLYEWHRIKVFMTWVFAHMVSGAGLRPHFIIQNTDGTTVKMTAYAVVHSAEIFTYISNVLSVFQWSALVFLVYPFCLYFFVIRSKDMKEKKFVRGARIISMKEYESMLDKNNEKTDLPFGRNLDGDKRGKPVQMPMSAERKPTSIIGRPGVGKTVLMSQIISRLKDRDEKAVIYDFKGDMISRFYDPNKDIIINPLDRRSTGWSLLRSEIQTKMDINSCAASLIPLPHSASNADPFFNEGARDVFAGVLHFLYENGYRTNKDIWELVSAPGKDINRALASIPGGARGLRYIEDASSKQAISVLSVMMQYVKCFEYMTNFEGDFCINDWLQNGKGMIFISNYADIKETLKPILSLFIDLLSRKLLSMPDSIDRSIFIMLTEFGTLQRLSSVVDLFTNARSKGGKCYLDIQDFGQIDKLYGKDHRQSILNACGNFVTFALADNTAAKIASERLGEAEYTEIEKTSSMGVSDRRDGVSFAERTKKEPLFLPSEIIDLPELTAIVRFANYGMMKTKLDYVPYPINHDPFDMIEEINLTSAWEFENRLVNMEDVL